MYFIIILTLLLSGSLASVDQEEVATIIQKCVIFLVDQCIYRLTHDLFLVMKTLTLQCTHNEIQQNMPCYKLLGNFNFINYFYENISSFTKQIYLTVITYNIFDIFLKYIITRCFKEWKELMKRGTLQMFSKCNEK